MTFVMVSLCNNRAIVRCLILFVAVITQGNHDKCHADSRCKGEGYVTTKKLLTDTRAIAAYKKAISGTSIYRHAADYMRVTICFFFLETQ